MSAEDASIVTIFRSRLKPDALEAYQSMALEVSGIVREMPGYIDHKVFIASDGERLTVVEFETMEALENWRKHPDHLEAKRRGIKEFFASYSYQIMQVLHKRNRDLTRNND